ncbi:DMT family transporter [Ferrovibrio xuzhouensis]|uniref:DMT family transporter n=1 Tax=Ferrovibrio xuzhouensis TaxID=1576914 RepID=A0ABV7VG59_9PROT
MKPGRGDLAMLTSVFIWGNTFPTAKYVLTVLPPPVYAASRYLLAALTLMLVLALRGGLQPPRRQDLPGLAALGFVGITLMQLLWTNALDLTTASKGAILVSVAPIFALLISSFRGQRLSVSAWAGVALSFAGVFLVINNSVSRITLGGGTLTGDLLFLAVAFCWANYSVFATPYLARLGALRTTAWSMLFGALMLSPALGFGIGDIDWGAITPGIIACYLFTAFVAGALGYLFWYAGIARLGIARSVIYSYLIPVFALLSAVTFLGEHVSPVQFAGAAVVITGLVLTRISPVKTA